MSDRALLASWYDLADDGRDAYLDWLHNKYIRKLLAAPGVLSAAHYAVDQSEVPLPHLRHTDDTTLPTGNGYILILTGGDAHVFSRLSSYRLQPTATERRMLGMRIGERVNLFTEEARVLGPDARRREGRYTLSPGIQMGNFNSGSWRDEDELLSWYADLRLPSFRKMPSGVALRKLASVSGWAKHGVLYEFTSLEDRSKYFRAHEAKNKKHSQWTHDVVAKLVHAPGSPAVARRIWPPVKERTSRR